MNEEFKAKIIEWLKLNSSLASILVDDFIPIDIVAENIEAQLYGKLYRFPSNMSRHAIEQVRSEIRSLIVEEIKLNRKANDPDYNMDYDE